MTRKKLNNHEKISCFTNLLFFVNIVFGKIIKTWVTNHETKIMLKDLSKELIHKKFYYLTN